MDAAVNTINEIERLKDLALDWDSYGAEPIERSALDSAKQFVLDLADLALFAGMKFVSPEVGPAPDAGVALVWPDRGRGEVEARFSPYGNRFVVVQNRTLVSQGPIERDRGFLKLFIDYLRS
jgi:hypothetical protein